MLQLKDITKSYNDKVVISDVSLDVERGQSVVVTAPSGAGKSTLLSIAGLLLKPNAGTVVFDGEDTAEFDDTRLAHLRASVTGFLFQHTQLLGSLRAIENVEVGACFVPDRTLSGSQVHARAEELLDRMGLADRLHHYPSQLSVGQKRRVAAARALLMRPRLLIADEPTNDLDEECADIVMTALLEPVRAGEAGLLMATHDKRLVERADTHVSL